MFAEYYCNRYDVELDKILDYENTVDDLQKCVDYRVYFKDGTSLDIANRVIFHNTPIPSFSLRCRDNTDAEFVKLWEAYNDDGKTNIVLLIAFADQHIKNWLVEHYDKGVTLDSVTDKLKTKKGHDGVLKHIKQICGCPIKSFFDVYALGLFNNTKTKENQSVSFTYVECSKVKELTNCYYDVYTKECSIDLDSL